MKPLRFELALYNVNGLDTIQKLLITAKVNSPVINKVYLEQLSDSQILEPPEPTGKLPPCRVVPAANHRDFINEILSNAHGRLIIIDLNYILQFKQPAAVFACLLANETPIGDIVSPHQPTVITNSALNLAAWVVDLPIIRKLVRLPIKQSSATPTSFVKTLTSQLALHQIEIQHHPLTDLRFEPIHYPPAAKSTLPPINSVDLRQNFPQLQELDLAPTLWLTNPIIDRPRADIPVTLPKQPLRVALIFNKIAVGGLEWFWIRHAVDAHPDLQFHVFSLFPAGDKVVNYLAEHRLAYTYPPPEIQDEWHASEWLEPLLTGFDVIQFSIQRMWSRWPTPPQSALVCTLTAGNRPETITDQMYRRLDVALNISQENMAANKYTFSPRTEQYMLPFGIDPKPLDELARQQQRLKLGIPQDAKVIIWSARMSAWEKNLPLLQKSIESTADQNVWWLVIGYFVTEAESQPWAQFCQGRRVTWLNNVVNWEMDQYYQLADIVASTSLAEGLGLTLIEGMAHGLVPIATDSGGVRDIILNDQMGVLTPSNDEAFITALHQLLNLPSEQFRAMSRQAQAHIATHYQPETASSQLNEIYQGAVTRRQSASITNRQPDRTPLIIFVFQGPDVGGMPWRAFYTAAQLQQQGARLHFIFQNREPTAAGPTLLDYFGKAALTFECASDHFGLPLLPFGTFDWYLGQRLKQLQPDIVQIGWLSQLPTNGFHSAWRTMIYVAGYTTIEQLERQPNLVAQLDSLVCVSPDIKHRLPADWQPKAVVIRSAVINQWYRLFRFSKPKVRSILQIPEQRLTLFWAGRLHDRHKRPDLLMRLIHEFPECHFIVAAIATPPQTEREYWGELQTAANVTLLCDLTPKDLVPLYQAADIGLSTSEMEGLSIASLEMLASSLPLLHTACDGAGELVEDGQNGYLVPVGDYEALAAALRRFIALTPAQRMQMGNHSGIKANRKFAFPEYIRRYAELYGLFDRD